LDFVGQVRARELTPQLPMTDLFLFYSTKHRQVVQIRQST
jgi:hypothetical protein